MATDQELIEWNRRGLIPGPQQTEEQFRKKIAVLEGLGAERMGSKEVLETLFDLYDVTPDWLSVIHEQRGLALWEGAATWQDVHPEGYVIPAIQLRRTKEGSVFSRLYPPEERVAHEAVHAIRSDFDEPRFEEILAYQTSKKGIRRYLGPIFRKPREALGFVGVLLVSVLVQGVDCFVPLPSWTDLLLLLPWMVGMVGLVRLYRDQRVFQRCLKRLERLAPLALRLTDAEIALFAESSWQEIQAYLEKVRGESFRWRMLHAVYFSATCDGVRQERF